ncbi:hypothetical protein Ahy_B05g078802 [Arachis hypogaea]|uniref:Uncharacterized protein n=1 Tax=Arachis hypogaea TaxID=3818 RepID=A0A444Z853_ARAHY|nr:hypothetical protein Ahy_B05g078802 [Arachis hypogaea]
MGLDAVGEEVNVDELGDIDTEEDNNDGEEEFEANYEVDDENDDEDLAGNPALQNEADAIVSQHPFSVPSFMRILDLEAMHALEFPEYANMGEGNVATEVGYFRIEQEYNKNYQRLKEQEFATKRVDESFRRAGNIVVNRFDMRNEMFEVERLSCRHVLACCTNQHLDWQVYVHDMYKISEICKIYRDEFVPMGDPSMWARYEGAKMIAIGH